MTNRNNEIIIVYNIETQYKFNSYKHACYGVSCKKCILNTLRMCVFQIFGTNGFDVITDKIKII